VLSNLQHLFRLDGKVALITGGGSGLGAAIAEGYAGYGAKVVLVDVDQAQAQQVAQTIEAAGGAAIALACDVASSADVTAAVAQTLAQFGKIDILVNNAGIGQRSPAEDMTDDAWDRVLDINLSGIFYFCRQVGRAMIERGQGGRIINMASIAGLVGVETGNVNYSASKGGVIALTRCLAIEWAKHAILVNAIAPSHTRTALIERLMQEKPETRSYFLNNIPLGRLGEVEDIVGPAIFLGSEAAAFITGQVLVVDGGHTAR
jgi:gluconate 5-dehydrogenase